MFIQWYFKIIKRQCHYIHSSTHYDMCPSYILPFFSSVIFSTQLLFAYTCLKWVRTCQFSPCLSLTLWLIKYRTFIWQQNVLMFHTKTNIIYENIWTLKQFLGINKLFFQMIGPISHCLTSHTLSSVLRLYQCHLVKEYSIFRSIVLDYEIKINQLAESDRIFVGGALGNYSLAGFEMILHRHISHYIINYYLPSGLFVVVSWISFLVPADIIPGKLTIWSQ